MSIFKPKTATITIYPGDYLDRIRHLEALAEADFEAKDPLPLVNGDKPQYLTLAEQHDALVKEAEAEAVHVIVQALPRKVWTALTKAHPPRTAATEGATEREILFDTRAGVNEASFGEAFVTTKGQIEIDSQPVEFASVIGPDGITDDDIDALASIDFQRIYLTAFALNRAAGDDPKASLVSRLTQPNSETSNEPSN